MSLFKAREFWSILCDIDEKFDQNCLEVSSLNGDTDKIIIGSHSGILRIYEPSTELNEDNTLIGYKPTDLLIEKIFPDPVLQISAGKLVSGSLNIHVVILHPKSIAVYSIVSREGVAEHGSQNMLKLMYEHKLRRYSYNFVVGPFGGVQNRDFICVQSLDGLLTFFEQESFTFCCFLPDFLLPGPLIYAQKTDSFITIGSKWIIESFKYKHLSEIAQNSTEEDSTGVKIESGWSFNLGEGAIDLKYSFGGPKVKDGYVSVLGERNFFCLHGNGQLRFMKKLDFSPICFFQYDLEEENLMTLIITDTNTLLIYQNTTVKWSAQLTFLPVAIRRAFFKHTKGAIVLLSEDGKLECCYLGTEPQLFSAPPLAFQELDFEKAEQELASLNKIIRSIYSGDSKLINTAAERELQIKITINPHLEDSNFTTNSILSGEKLQMCHASVDLIPQALLEEVQISIRVRNPLVCTKSAEFYNNVKEKVTFQCYVYLAENLEVPNLDFEVILSYISNLGVPRVIKKLTFLPLNLVAKSCLPSKENEHKITLNINQNPVPLTTIFPEFIGENSLTLTSNAIGFKNKHEIGCAVTILLAKNTQRYRLQSDSVISLNKMTKEMILRLSKHFAGVNDFKISYSSGLPTAQFLVYVRKHFTQKQTVIDLQNKLSQLGGQFRIVQKRLISKFKDKHPTPLSNLEKLLQETHNEIINTSTELNVELCHLGKAQNELSCALELLVSIIKIMDINKDVLPTLETAFTSAIYDLEGQYWEDTLDASLCYLLRTLLSKLEKDMIKAAHTSFEEITDVTKLEKHITQVLERITKAEIKETCVDESNVSESKEDVAQNTAELVIPIGSRIGESSSRILSARKNLLRRRQIN